MGFRNILNQVSVHKITNQQQKRSSIKISCMTGAAENLQQSKHHSLKVFAAF